MISDSYNGLDENSIRAMSHKELISAMLRIVALNEINMQDWRGSGIPSDNIANAIRGRK